MSFVHYLPSNTSSETFPKNNAGIYSTPVDNPHIFNGEWEVALIKMFHSNCIYTFNHEKIKVRHKATPDNVDANIRLQIADIKFEENINYVKNVIKE